MHCPIGFAIGNLDPMLDTSPTTVSESSHRIPRVPVLWNSTVFPPSITRFASSAHRVFWFVLRGRSLELVVTTCQRLSYN